MIHLGFSGTRYGMTFAQYETVKVLLVTLHRYQHGDMVTGVRMIVHHGLCEGADKQFHHIAKATPGTRVVGHPPPIRDLAMDPEYVDCDELRPPARHLKRNDAIVDESLLMITAPPTVEPQIRGGTWYTIRRAIARGRPTAIVAPDGAHWFYNHFGRWV